MRRPYKVLDYPNPRNYAASPGGILVPETVLMECAKDIVYKPTAVDLFSGCGGMSLGVIDAGYEVVCAVENSPEAAITYLANLGQYPMRIHFVTDEDAERFGAELVKSIDRSKKTAELYKVPICGAHRPPDCTPVRSFIFGDIRNVTGELIAEVAGLKRPPDTICGGPPCQGFSQANRNAGPHDWRNALVFEMARIIAEMRPVTYIMENVPRIQKMTTPEGFPVIDLFTEIAEGRRWPEAIKKVARKKKNSKAYMPKRKKPTAPEPAPTPQLDLFE